MAEVEGGEGILGSSRDGNNGGGRNTMMKSNNKNENCKLFLFSCSKNRKYEQIWRINIHKTITQPS